MTCPSRHKESSVVSRVIIDNRSRGHGSVTEPRAPASGLRTPSETLDQVEKINRDTTLAALGESLELRDVEGFQ